MTAGRNCPVPDFFDGLVNDEERNQKPFTRDDRLPLTLSPALLLLILIATLHDLARLVGRALAPLLGWMLP